MKLASNLGYLDTIELIIVQRLNSSDCLPLPPRNPFNRFRTIEKKMIIKKGLTFENYTRYSFYNEMILLVQDSKFLI